MSIFTRTAGTIVTSSVLFTLPASSITPGPADPGEVTVIIEKPDESTVTHVWPSDSTIVRDGVGRFHVDIGTVAGDDAGYGVWTVEWQGQVSGPQVVVDSRFNIDANAID